MIGFKSLRISFFVFLAISCSTKSDEQMDVLQEPWPKSLDKILEQRNPLDFYIDAYGSFRLDSKSTFTLSKNGSQEPRIYEGKTILEWDDRGNYHLIRDPFMKKSSIELVYFNQKSYLRSGKGTEFRVLQNLKEFEHWTMIALREIFSLYEQVGFGTNSSPVTQDQLSCTIQKMGKLCVDPATGLPLNGNLTMNPRKDCALKVEFSITPQRVEPIHVGALVPSQ